jgi:hypothetical protein
MVEWCNLADIDPEGARMVSTPFFKFYGVVGPMFLRPWAVTIRW